MKKLLLLSLAVIALHPRPARADYDTVLGQELGLRRSPTFTQQTLDSDIRLRGMGFLNLAVRDDSNEIGLWRFGGLAAGLPLDYRDGKAEAGLFTESGEIDDKSTEVDGFTGHASDLSKRTMSLMAAVPFQISSQNLGTLVVAKMWDGAEFELTPGAAGGLSESEEVSVRDFTIAYGHNIGSLLAGIDIRHIVDRDQFEIGGSEDDSRLYRTDISPSIGYRWYMSSGNRFTVAGGPRFSTEEFDYSPGGVTEYEADGTRLAAGAMFEHLENIRVGAFFNTGKIDGDRDFDGTFAGTEELEETNLILRGYVRPANSPLALGMVYEANEFDEKITDEFATVLADDRAESSAVGLGVSYNFTDDRGLAGFEYRLLDSDDSDGLDSTDPTTNSDGKGFQYSLGGEWRFTDRLRARAGFRHRVQSNDPPGADPEADLELLEISAGGDFRVTDAVELVLALWSATHSQELVPATRDEAEYKGLGAQLLARYRWNNPGRPRLTR